MIYTSNPAMRLVDQDLHVGLLYSQLTEKDIQARSNGTIAEAGNKKGEQTKSRTISKVQNAAIWHTYINFTTFKHGITECTTENLTFI
jgi:hypothetical protein